MRKILSAVLLAIVSSTLMAQTQSMTYRPLEIGEELPDIDVNNVGNIPDETIRLADFKGKLLILDFWTTYCAACIASWPKLLKLQEQFNDEIQIILVNAYQGKDIIEKMLERQRTVKGVNMTLPYIAEDTVLKNKLFPHETTPHVVWISKEGKLISETSSDVLNERNIQSILRNEDVRLVEKTDTYYDYNYHVPLFIDGNNGNSDQLRWRTVLAKAKHSERPLRSLSADPETLGYQITMINHPIQQLYQLAYSEGSDLYGNVKLLPKSRLLFKVSDISKYQQYVDGELNRDEFYSYQTFSYHPVSRKQLQTKMQSDLSFQFGLDVEWKPMVKKCLVFTMKDSTLMADTTDAGFRLKMTDTVIEWNKVYMSYVIDKMETGSGYYHSEYPIIDETGFNGVLRNITVENVNVNDYRELDKALQQYGLRLQLKDRTVNMLVISEPGLLVN